MIARMWHGRTKLEDADTYFAFLQERAIPDYKSVAGNVSVEILRRFDNNICHFITLTFWDNLEAIKGFAGEEVELAKYYEEDKNFLLEFEPTVAHYEVAE